MTSPSTPGLRAVGELSPAMRAALESVADGNREGSGHRFRTLEALRRRGLLERHTFDVSRAWFANETGIHPQSHWKGEMHQWFIAPFAYRSALGGSDG